MTRRCPGCRAVSSRTRGCIADFDIRACTTCGTLFTASLPAAHDATDYESYYDEYRSVPVPDFVFGRLRENVRALGRYRQLGSWLDIGCGAGTLLRAAEEEGWRALGTEVARPTVDALRAAGLDVRHGETSALDLPAGSFDVVSLIEVVEHVDDPSGVLRDAARLVRPGGAIYVTTPHARGLTARVLGTRWSVVAPPEHLQLFSVAGLRSALARSGVRVASISTHGANPYEITAAVRSRRSPIIPAHRVEAAYRANEAVSSRRVGSVLKKALNGALSALRLGDTLKVVAERPSEPSDRRLDSLPG